MSERIGQARIEVRKIEQKTSSPLQDDWQGTLIIEGSKQRFSTEIEGLKPDTSYLAVYERTETLTGEPIVRIHEITNLENKEPEPS